MSPIDVPRWDFAWIDFKDIDALSGLVNRDFLVWEAKIHASLSHKNSQR